MILVTSKILFEHQKGTAFFGRIHKQHVISIGFKLNIYLRKSYLQDSLKGKDHNSGMELFYLAVKTSTITQGGSVLLSLSRRTTYFKDSSTRL